MSTLTYFLIGGKMCSLIGFVEAFVPVIYTPLYSLVYSSTLKSFSGAFYILGGLMTLPAIFIFLYMYYISKKEGSLPETQKSQDASSKEAYAYDNPVNVTTS